MCSVVVLLPRTKSNHFLCPQKSNVQHRSMHHHSNYTHVKVHQWARVGLVAVDMIDELIGGANRYNLYRSLNCIHDIEDYNASMVCK